MFTVCHCAAGRFRLYAGVVILVSVILLPAVGALSTLQSTVIGAFAALLCSTLTISEVFHAVHPRVLLTLIASMGVGQAVAVSGVPQVFAKVLIQHVDTTSACTRCSLL